MKITEADIEAWLATKRHVLWADWDLSMDDRRVLAARWFLRQLDDMQQYLRTTR